jgi:hypothetical protein
LKRHLDRTVDHDAERALLVVLADEGESPRKMGIDHVGHGDQEVPRKVDFLHVPDLLRIVMSGAALHN